MCVYKYACTYIYVYTYIFVHMQMCLYVFCNKKIKQWTKYEISLPKKKNYAHYITCKNLVYDKNGFQITGKHELSDSWSCKIE